MTTLCIQIQPHRVSGLDVSAIQTACENIASDRNLVRDFCVVTGGDATEYVNLMF